LHKNIQNLKKKCGLFWENKTEAIEREIAKKKLSLKEVKSKDFGNGANEHHIIEADNLAGLTYLQKEGKEFKIIYIDPPYNTGNKNFNYKDHFVDEDDELQHSDWVSFMYKRLLIAKSLLEEDGAIFISIDDYEHARLKLLCDGIFGQHNFVANFIRKNKAGSGHDSKQVAIEFDYMLCYAKNIKNLRFQLADAKADKDKKYRLVDEHFETRGKYYLRDLDYKGTYSKSMDYAIQTADGKELWSGGGFGPPNTWRWSKEKFKWGLENDYIVFKKKKNGWKVYIKQYQFVDNNNQKRIRKIPHRAMIEFSNSKGSNELKDILKQDIFSYPKPTDLIRFVIDLFEDKSLRILDFFAGSGSTLHACMLANKKDGGNRNCTLITNNENNICEAVTYPRNRKAIEGYTTRRGRKVEALPNNRLRYFKIQLKNG